MVQPFSILGVDKNQIPVLIFSYAKYQQVLEPVTTFPYIAIPLSDFFAV